MDVKKIIITALIIIISLNYKINVYAMNIDEYDFSGIDDFLDQNDETKMLEFSDLVNSLIGQSSNYDKKSVAQKIISIVTDEITANYRRIAAVVILALCSAIFSCYISAFDECAVTDTSMLIVRMLQVCVLMTIFSQISQVLTGVMEKLTEFMEVLLPVYSFSIAFATGTLSSIALRQGVMTAFMLSEYAILKFMIPMIKMYVMIMLVNSISGRDDFKKLGSLFKTIIVWCNNAVIGIIAGVNIIKNMTAPYADKTACYALGRAVSLIPGVGNTFAGIGDIVTGTGVLIRNSIGAAGLIVIICIAAVPVIRLSVAALLYRLVCALLEPVADKKLTEGTGYLSDGAVLLLKAALTGAAMFMITIGMVCV